MTAAEQRWAWVDTGGRRIHLARVEHRPAGCTWWPRL